MEISRPFRPLRTELGEWEMDSCYKQVAPNGASALRLAPVLYYRWMSRVVTWITELRPVVNRGRLGIKPSRLIL
jgi:hypothetical protein